MTISAQHSSLSAWCHAYVSSSSLPFELPRSDLLSTPPQAAQQLLQPDRERRIREMSVRAVTGRQHADHGACGAAHS